MAVLKSLLYSLKACRLNPFTILHNLAYAATVNYLRVLKHLVKRGPPALRRRVSAVYHGKVVTLADAGRIITVNRNIELRNLDQVIPYRRAQDLILINPHNIAVYQCPCRSQKQNPCQPIEVCLIVGEPFADLVRLVQPFRSRRITVDEALQILREEDKRGHVHTAWFKAAMLDRFFAICNCCTCCCLGMKFMTQHHMKMLLPSGYRAVVGAACIGCNACRAYCQFEALELTAAEPGEGGRQRCVVNRERCFGCGVCESKCPRQNITLVLDPTKGIPLDIDALQRERAGMTTG